MSYSKLSDESPEARSSSPVTDHIDQLAILFPSVVREGKVDFEALKELLGEHVAKDGELFGLEWKGKAEARHWATVQSLGTLRPCREDSVDWEHTKNLYIEGDNLEVLKLLRKSYVGKVKVIYIDPPYNTGKDFVYADDYRNGIEEYKQLTGQNGVFSANQETSGSYHTAWLNMMYPRLLLAKDLLREDGVIFISIDDTECADLRKICEEIFGEVNFLAQIVWERAYSPINLMKHFSPAHDYIVCFAKNEALAQCNGLKRSSTANDRYSNPDNDPRGSWKPSDLSVGPAVEENIYPITTPSGRVVEPPAGRSWSLSKKAFLERLQDNRIWFGPQGNSVPSMKRFLTELRKEGITPMTYWRYDEVGHSQDATKKLAEIFDGKKIFLYPKPVNLIKRCISLYAGPNDLVLDFFSGSSTTGHSVLELNVERENSGGVKYILVQLPEPCEENSDAYKAGYKNICEIGKERLRRAGRLIKEEAGPRGHDLDIGFRVYKLDSSNLRAWNPEVDDLELALGSYEKHLVEGRTQEDLLYEILLKQGIELTEDAHCREIAGELVYSLGYGQYYACMETKLPSHVIEELALGIASWKQEENPDDTQCAVFVIDEAFENDSDKLNFDKILEQHGIPMVKAL